MRRAFDRWAAQLLLGAGGLLAAGSTLFSAGSSNGRLLWIGLAALVVVAALGAGAFLGLPRPAFGREAVTALALLAAFVSWNGISVLWSIEPDRSWDYFNRGLVYLAFALVPLVHWVVYHSRFGLRLRACGENPHAADAAGVNVEATRYIAMLIAGVLCSFSGAYLAIVQSGFFLRDMSAGAGYLALTALVFGNWRPIYTALGCIMFGFFSAVQIQMEGVDLPGVGRIPGSLIQMIPYVVTVIVLAGLMAKSVAPKAIGKPFVKSR